MSLGSLISEYEAVGIGPLLLREIEATAEAVVSRYNPTVYAGTSTWADAIEDLVQEFVLTILIGEQQLEYVILHSVDLEHLQRLLSRQLRRLLARSRRRTVVDNLLDRCKHITASEPFVQRAQRSKWSFTLAGQTPNRGSAAPEQLRDVAIRVSLVRPIRSEAETRAPLLYSEDTLRSILYTVAHSLDFAVTNADLDTIFRQALTSWIPSFLPSDEGSIEQIDATQPDPGDGIAAQELAGSVLNACDVVQKEVLRQKLAGVSDGEIALHLGLSRPTVAKRKKEVLTILETALSETSESLQVAIIDHICLRLAIPSEGSNAR